MNLLLWGLQCLAAVLYGSSGVMKLFLFDNVSHDVPSFGAMPRSAWAALGVLELVCVTALILPPTFRRHPELAIGAAAILALESLVFVWVHLKYRETSATVLSGVLGLAMAFIAYGRTFLHPIL